MPSSSFSSSSSCCCCCCCPCMRDACADCMAETCLGKSCIGPNRMLVRYVYACLFLLGLFLAWMLHDFSHNALSQFSYLRYCNGDGDCLGSEGVLRISFGGFLFYFVMYITTVGTSKTNDPRDSWHTGWWPIKSLLWLLLMVVPFFMPPTVIKFYGEVARFGGGIFLLVQLLAILNFVYWWNEQWLSEKNVRQCQLPMLLISIVSYAFAIFGLIIMYIWFAPQATCSLNIFFITWTLIAIVIATGISLHSKVNAGLMTSGFLSLYVVFLCWSALASEPLSHHCNVDPRSNRRRDWDTVLSFLLGAFAVVLAIFSTGIDPKSLSLQNEEADTNGEVPYGYGFVHFVLCLGTMYFVMLFMGWDLQPTIQKWTLDFGWATVWVKIINEWFAIGLYVWTMFGPLILQHRDFSWL